MTHPGLAMSHPLGGVYQIAQSSVFLDLVIPVLHGVVAVGVGVVVLRVVTVVGAHHTSLLKLSLDSNEVLPNHLKFVRKSMVTFSGWDWGCWGWLVDPAPVDGAVDRTAVVDVGLVGLAGQQRRRWLHRAERPAR